MPPRQTCGSAACLYLRSFASPKPLTTRSRFVNWRNMYGPPTNCKKNLGATRTVCENVSGLLVENALRAHDDDPHVPVLLIPPVVKDLVTPQVLRHVV